MAIIRSLFIALAALTSTAALPPAAMAQTAAVELVMYRRAGCPYCAQWDREVGPVYPKTEVGRALPLRLADLDQPSDQKIFLASPVRYTPTFVLVADRREIVRLEGYPGEDFFWGFLDSHFKRLQRHMRDEISVPASPPEPGSTAR
jgi:hypothetical protein